VLEYNEKVDDYDAMNWESHEIAAQFFL
jgi:hypothetical protein